MIEKMIRQGGVIIALLLAFCSVPLPAYSSSAFDYSETSKNPSLNMTVSWNEPKGGEPTVFHLEGMGGSGDYQYMLNAVDLFNSDNPRNDFDCEPVTDASRHPQNGYAYQDGSEISFTFMASGLYRMWFNVRDVNTNGYARFLLRVKVNDPSYPTVPAQIDKVVKDCLAAGKTTDFDKALWLHDWLIGNMDYDNDLLYCGAEGAFLRGEGTCETYHRAYEKLLQKAGLRTGRIEGNGHVWTAVRIDGQWCQVDATWDDTDSYAWTPDLRHLFFGLDDHIMGLVHSDHNKPVAGYESNTLENNYFIRTGEIKKWSNPYVGEIRNRLNGGEENFALSVENSHWPANYKDVMYNLVAYDLSKRNWDAVGDSSDTRIEVQYSNDSLSVQLKKAEPLGSWKGSGDKRWYQFKDGSYPQACWASIDGAWYHFDAAGYMQTGWLRVGGAWYWLDPVSGKMATGWQDIGSSRYYMDASGAMATGWLKDAGRWYWCSNSGAMARSAWLNLYGAWYRLGADGAMLTGFQQIGGSRFLFNGSGVMQTGWARVDGAWHWFNSGGYMQTGWLRVGGAWYWLDPVSGKMATGWQDIGSSRYYMDASGAMATGWLKDAGRWYWCSNSGAMARSAWLNLYGAWYRLGADGAMLTGFQQIGGSRFLFNGSGVMQTGWRWIDGECYYFNSAGYMQVSKWIGDCWVDENGVWDAQKKR